MGSWRSSTDRGTRLPSKDSMNSRQTGQRESIGPSSTGHCRCPTLVAPGDNVREPSRLMSPVTNKVPATNSTTAQGSQFPPGRGWTLVKAIDLHDLRRHHRTIAQVKQGRSPSRSRFLLTKRRPTAPPPLVKGPCDPLRCSQVEHRCGSLIGPKWSGMATPASRLYAARPLSPRRS